MDDAELRRRIVGTWKLVSVHYEDQATTARTPIYGEHTCGIWIATVGGKPISLRGKAESDRFDEF